MAVNTTGRGSEKTAIEVGGVSSQLLRHIEILLVSPWKISLGEESGFALAAEGRADRQPGKLLAQKILIRNQRDYRDKAKDLLYMHDAVELFSECLDELRGIFRNDLVPRLHPRRVTELEQAADRLFGKVDDAIREASAATA